MKNGQWFMVDGGCGAEEPAQMTEFGLFPNEAVADEDGVNSAVAAGQLGEHHATVEAAADQSTNGRT